MLKVPKNRFIVEKLAVDKIMDVKGPVLAEDPGLIVAAGKTVYVQSFAITKLIQNGKLDPSYFYDKLRARFFSIVVLNSKLTKLNHFTLARFTKPSLMLIYDNYEFDTQFGPYYFYRRKE